MFGIIADQDGIGYESPIRVGFLDRLRATMRRSFAAHGELSMAGSISALVFGGCTVHNPLYPIAKSSARFKHPNYGTMPATYTFGEMFQTIGVLRGERDVSQELRPLCAMKPNFRPVARAANFSDVDVVLIEPSSSIDLEFRGCNLNRAMLAQTVVNPIGELSREARKCCNLWFRSGLMGLNEEVRRQRAEELVNFIPEGMKDAALIKAMVTELRSSKADVYEGFRRMGELVGRPMGVVIYVFRYLEDGRYISWPADFHEEVKDAAGRLDLPMFDPAAVVVQYGLKKAMKEDLKHYSDEFLPFIGNALVDFAFSVRESASALAA